MHPCLHASRIAQPPRPGWRESDIDLACAASARIAGLGEEEPYDTVVVPGQACDDDSTGWKPAKERPMWPWVVLAAVAIGVGINVLLTV
ncbi:hypothetical protein [Streptomyces sp. NPDC054834]